MKRGEAPNVVHVVVTVTENGETVAEHDIAYFVGQPYKVEIATPDGTDYVVVDRTTAKATA